MLLRKDARGKRIVRIVIQNRDGSLKHDRTGIELFVDEVHGTSRYLDTIRQRLVLRIESRESRQKRWMDIEDTLRERLDELGAEQAKIACEADEIDVVSPEFFDQQAVINRPIKTFGWERNSVKAAVASYLQPRRRFAIRNDNRDFGVEPAIAEMESAIAWKFDPRPEIRMPSRLTDKPPGPLHFPAAFDNRLQQGKMSRQFSPAGVRLRRASFCSPRKSCPRPRLKLRR